MIDNTDFDEPIYPVYYKGKEWLESDCDDIFVNLYWDRFALNIEGGIYMGEGLYVFPDGSMDEW
jgi:hypothetical protein